MVAYLTKSDASEGFTQIINFLNGSNIKYALTVNPNIYVSCIKQFWITVAIKQVNDVTRLQALVDKKKVVVIEAAIREVLRLDDAKGVDCLPNKEIFIELARMRYEKPSTKLMFYKAFFLRQWNLVRNVDSTTKFYMYLCFLQLLIRKHVCDLLTHTTKYTSPALTQKVFANMRRVGKGFSGVETPLFEGMPVGQEIEEEGDVDEHVKDVTVGDDAHGDDTAAHGEVPTVTQEPSIPSPTPTYSTTTTTSISLFNISGTTNSTTITSALDACAALTRRVEHLEYDKVAQALEITKLKRRGMMIAKIDKDDVVILMDDKEEDKKEEEAKIVESAQEDEIKPAEVQVVVDVVTTVKLITKVVTATSETVTAISAFIPTEPKPLKKKQQIKIDKEYARKLHAELNNDIDWDVAIDHVKLKAKEDPVVKRYKAMKRKPQTKAQARKNMMMYLKNVAGFKLDYFKGMSYDDIRLIFEAKFNLNVDFLLKTKEQMEEEENRALQTINVTPTEKAAKRRKLNKEEEDLKRHFEILPDEDDDVYTEATPLARKVHAVDYEIIKINNKPY
uniref:Xylulose kinase-1 n=1 Tax=Tanacetum cinerariifolium TaxID=118510 RepID=A0A6L2JYX2_TANCI|nr:xylulose kinase-1 [Tanacetum cinerariifolium]